MAAPQRRYRSTLPTEPAWPARERLPEQAGAKKRAHGKRGRFAILVIVPVLLMLGSVYLHTVSAEVGGRAAALQEDLDSTRAAGERLEVRVAELSAADRVRPLAREKLGMRDAGSGNLEVIGKREDGTTDEGEERGGEPRPR